MGIGSKRDSCRQTPVDDSEKVQEVAISTALSISLGHFDHFLDTGGD